MAFLESEYRMRIGLQTPGFRPANSIDEAVAMVEQAEQIGMHSVWLAGRWDALTMVTMAVKAPPRQPRLDFSLRSSGCSGMRRTSGTLRLCPKIARRFRAPAFWPTRPPSKLAFGAASAATPRMRSRSTSGRRLRASSVSTQRHCCRRY